MMDRGVKDGTQILHWRGQNHHPIIDRLESSQWSPHGGVVVLLVVVAVVIVVVGLIVNYWP